MIIKTAWANELVINYKCASFTQIKHGGAFVTSFVLIHDFTCTHFNFLLTEFSPFCRQNETANCFRVSLSCSHSTYFSWQIYLNIHFHLPYWHACLEDLPYLQVAAIDLRWIPAEWSKWNVNIYVTRDENEWYPIWKTRRREGKSECGLVDCHVYETRLQ